MAQADLQAVLDAGLYEYGCDSEPLSRKWEPFFNGRVSVERLMIAYNNADRTFASLSVFTDEDTYFYRGLSALCKAFQPKTLELYLPEIAGGQLTEHAAGQLSSFQLKGTVVSGKVDVRTLAEDTLVHHPETAVNIGRLLDGKSPVLSVRMIKGEETADIRVPLDATIAETAGYAGFSYHKASMLLVGGIHLLKAADDKGHLYGYSNSCIEILDEKICVVALAKQIAVQAYQDTCGKCTFCREGNYQLAEFLKKAVTGHSEDEDLEWVQEIADAVAEESVCSFGRESVRFLLETMPVYAKDYDAHIRGKRCPDGICQAFTDFAVEGALCIGCGACREICPSGAILDDPGFIHRIDAFDCTKCGQCQTVCPAQAIRRVRVGRLIGPDRKMKVGRYRSTRRWYHER